MDILPQMSSSESRTNQNEAYMPFFTGDSYLELKGLQTYGNDLQ